jgi:hypothetical protein
MSRPRDDDHSHNTSRRLAEAVSGIEVTRAVAFALSFLFFFTRNQRGGVRPPKHFVQKYRDRTATT